MKEDAVKRSLAVSYTHLDISREEPVSFEITNPAFLSAYFKYAHHPNEEKGVDFWWLDWQQGGITKMEGLDPLWMLNHFHFLDSARNGKRPMTFSRYADVYKRQDS